MTGPTNPTTATPPPNCPVQRPSQWHQKHILLTNPPHCEPEILNRCDAEKLRASLTSSESSLAEAREALRAAQAEGGRLAERERERAAQAAAVSEREHERERERAVQAGAAAAAREGELEGQLAAAARLQVFPHFVPLPCSLPCLLPPPASLLPPCSPIPAPFRPCPCTVC